MFCVDFERRFVMLETKRLKLVPLNIKHAEHLLKLWSDYEVIKYTYSTLITTQEECNEKVKTWVDKYSEKVHSNNFVIIYNDEVIGVSGFPTVNYEKGQYGLYYQLRRKYWHKGLGFEAAQAILTHIFEKTNATQILADAVTMNLASISILKKLGFKQTHIEHDRFKNNGFVIDIVNLNLNKEEWMKAN